MNIEDRRILEIKVGSHLYGTNTPESDQDYAGIFIPTIDYYLGLKKIEEQDCSITSKDKDGKNNKDAIDRKFHEIKKYFTLALNINPNIIEYLFSPTESIVFINDVGQKILDNRDIFLSQLCKKSFLGYSAAQKHKMIIKTDKLKELIEGLEYLEKWPDKATVGEVRYSFLNGAEMIKDEANCPFGLRCGGQHIKCGDIHLEVASYVKKARQKIKERIDKATNRKENILKYGFDTKFGSHLVRVLLECKELLEDQIITFPLKDKDLILDIKLGKYKIEEVIELAEELEKEIEAIDSKLPQVGNFNAAEELLIEILEDYFGIKYQII